MPQTASVPLTAEVESDQRGDNDDRRKLQDQTPRLHIELLSTKLGELKSDFILQPGKMKYIGNAT